MSDMRRMMMMFTRPVDGGGGGDDPTPVLPYDAQVEYLQSSGTQYIETNIKYNVNNSYKIELYGSIGSTTGYALHGWDAGGAFGLYRNKLSNGNMSFGSLNFQDNLLLYNCIINAGTSTQSTLSVNWNGTIYSNSRAHGSLATYAGDKGYHLFCSWSKTIRNYYINGKIYYCKIYVNDLLVEDLIPVRIGQVGYLYDKISGELFGNSGTGSFTYGNDVTT